MFSAADNVGIRLNAWNTNPTRSRRSRVNSSSERVPRSVSPNSTRPEVRRSRPARQCISVDFPEPDGPMIDVKRPVSSSRSTSSRAVTEASPMPYTFVACSARAATAIANTSLVR
jgi:hypothetical protein